MDDSEISPLLDKLLNILGQITATCSYDTGNKPLSTTKSLVLLTQSHSSTLAQEIVDLLRCLHNIVGWNQVLNAILTQKLNLAAHFINDRSLTAMFNEGNASDQQQFMVIACLNVIGAWDTRPRIGGVVEIEGSVGSVVRVSPKGKLCVQMWDSGAEKKVTVNGLKLVQQMEFNFDKLALNESLVKTWASLLLNRQSGCLSGYEKKMQHGE